MSFDISNPVEDVQNRLYFVGDSSDLVGIGNYRGVFDNNVAYNKNDIVKDNLGNIFICLDGVTGSSGPTGIPLTNVTKWDQTAYNDTSFKFREVKIDGVDVGSNNFPNGVQQTITIPAGLMEVGDVIVLEAWMIRNSGGNTSWAIFIDNQQLTASMGTNGNNPCRVRMVVIKYGNNGSGSPADLVGYLDHSNSGGNGLRRGTIASRDTSVSFDVSLVKVGGTSNWRCEFYQAFIYKST